MVAINIQLSDRLPKEDADIYQHIISIICLKKFKSFH